MILKLLLIQASYIFLSITRVHAYVLFAANPDDFRSLARQIIPGRLADQLADMASKNKPMNPNLYERDGEYTDSTSKEAENDNDKDAELTISAKNPNTRFVVKDQKTAVNLDLDELVKRVKEKLEKDYKLSTPRSNNGLAPERAEKIEDYYYKDETNTALKGEVQQQTETPLPVYPFADNNSNVQATSNAPQYQDDDLKEDIYVDEEGNIKKYDAENVQEPEYKNEMSNTNAQVQEQNDGRFQDYEGLPNTNIQNQQQQNNVLNTNIQGLGKLKTFSNTDVQVPKYQNGISNANQMQIQGNNISNNKRISSSLSKKVKNEENVHVPEQYFEQDPEFDNNANNANYNVENEKDAVEYYDATPTEVTNKAPDKVDVFKEWDMKKTSNDSYEDYVIPEKDDVFASNEEPIKPPAPVQMVSAADNSKYNLNRPKAIADSVLTVDLVKKEIVTLPTIRTTRKQLEIKAKTESLWYKDPNIENYDDSTKSTTGDPSGTTKKKRMNTMFPTRAHFKMSSPNYLAKIPAVAEKYNFNEPIPEKDQEPEKLKHIANPPAFINKKVKLT